MDRSPLWHGRSRRHEAFPAPSGRERLPSFEQLKAQVSIETVLAHRGLMAALRRQGKRLVGPCPVHGGDNPGAFVVDRQKNLWCCFTACGGGGDVVELVRRLERVGYRDAARYLAALVGRQAPSVPPLPRPCATRPFRPFVKRLALDPTTPWLLAKGIAAATARDFEVGAWHGRGMLAGCVAVRLHDPDGRPIGYAGRRLDAEAVRRRGKWVFPPGLPKRRVLYGYHRIAAPRPLVVVECPWGVLRLHQLGLDAVALLGTNLSAIQRQLLAAHHPLTLLLDGDEAGRCASSRIHSQLHRRPHVLHLPDGCDPDNLDDGQLRHLVRSVFPS